MSSNFALALTFPEAIDFQEGPGILARDFRDKGVPLVRLAGLDQDANSVLVGCNYLDEDMVQKRWAHFALKEGDILLSTSASLGRVAVVGREAVGAIAYTGVIRMRPKDGRLFAPFIKYLLQGSEFQQQAEAVGAGSVMRHFGPMHLRDMIVTVPCLENQKAIARVLGALDEKIERNRRMNRTLEALAQKLFKSWFVDFDPVIAKSQNRKPFGLADEIAALFPDAFEDSEFGPIPKGWRVAALGDSFEIIMGQSPPGESYNEFGDGVRFYQGRAEFGFRFPTPRLFCNKPTRFAEAADTLVSVRAPVGDINMAEERCCIGRGLAAVRYRNVAPAYGLYRMKNLDEEFSRFDADGTLFGAIGGDDFRAIKVVTPPQTLVEQFEKIGGALERRIWSNEKESQKLAGLRDLLLPKLLSSEIRVPIAENTL